MPDGSPPFVIGDPRPDAPQLARPGPHGVGVHAFEIVDTARLDVAAALAGRNDPRYDRRLAVELFHPAHVRRGAPPLRYRDRFVPSSGDDGTKRTTTFTGRAQRDAEPDRSGAPYPLVVLSHGFLGSRFMLSRLAENLASKGYVVAALGHRDEEAPGAACFPATLLNRPLDQLFALDALAQRSAGGDERLAGLIDAGRSAVVGYSMGGYGALNVGGAGFAADFVRRSGLPAALAERQSGSVGADPRLKAIVALAPWGGPAALEASGHPGNACWNAVGLAGLVVPTLFVAGSDDDISGYEGGVRWLFDGAIGSDRFLLVYRHARHNVGPNPPPEEAWSDPEMFERYSEPVWDVRRINDVDQHFVTAFLGERLRGEALGDFLARPCAGDWLGFPPRSALGLELHRG